MRCARRFGPRVRCARPGFKPNQGFALAGCAGIAIYLIAKCAFFAKTERGYFFVTSSRPPLAPAGRKGSRTTLFGRVFEVAKYTGEWPGGAQIWRSMWVRFSGCKGQVGTANRQKQTTRKLAFMNFYCHFDFRAFPYMPDAAWLAGIHFWKRIRRG